MPFNAEFFDKATTLLLQVPGLKDLDTRNSIIHPLGEFAYNLERVPKNPRGDFTTVLRQLANVGQLADPDVPAVTRLLQLAGELAKGSKLAEQVNELARVSEILAAQPDPDPLDFKPEAVIVSDDRVDIEFVEGAHRAARGVAKLLVPDARSRESIGTAWLLSPDLLVTNWHVIACLEDETDKDVLADRVKHTHAVFDLWRASDTGEDAGPLELVTFSKPLDYAVVKLEKPSSRVPFPLAPDAPFVGMRVNIPQYGPGPLRFALRENALVSIDSAKSRLHYLSDTEPGASGSPVCDDRWHVVAVHHAARPIASVQVSGRSYGVHNQGISLAAILKDLTRNPDLRPYLGAG
jgi:V8-like Glu-specific endopeptidase